MNKRRMRYAGVTRAGMVLFMGTLVVRSCVGVRGESITMPTTAGRSTRWLGTPFDEGDMAAIGVRAVAATPGPLGRDADMPLVPDAMSKAYSAMRHEEGDVPSPVLPTYVGLESPEASDLVVIDGVDAPKGAVIFLHGYGGNSTLSCWLVARAAKAAALVTYCPSRGYRADWSGSDGARTLQKVVDAAHARGLERLILAGLSNGAAGAATLAPRMHGSFRGLILISGASASYSPPGIPVLVLHGRRDAVIGAGGARDYASKAGGSFVDLDGGHYALLVRKDDAVEAMRPWLVTVVGR